MAATPDLSACAPTSGRRASPAWGERLHAIVTVPVTRAATIARMPNPEWFAASKSPSQMHQAHSGEGLYEFEMDGSRFRCELRDFGEFGVEAQILANGEQWQACRFTVRALALRWADEMRDRLIRGELVDWP